MISLEEFGWNEFHHKNYLQSASSNEPRGRVISLHGFKYHLMTKAGEIEAELAGRLLYGAEPEDLPKVGDWVCFLDYDQGGYIIERLPRQNALSRKNPGKKTERQILGANIDYGCVVQGLDRDFNIMRIDRYVTQIIACGITPVVVLNKSDLIEDTAPYVQQVKDLRKDCDVFCCSTLTSAGINELQNSFQRGKTYMMVGSSGVGKSSLLNALMDSSIQATGSISNFNSKGRHTTTSRELFQLPNGSLLMDTPGMREFGVTDEEGADGLLFPAIEKFAVNCRYNDCTHMIEEGCAVLNALQTGDLDQTAYASYVKLVKEQSRFEINIEDRKKLNRQFGKIVKEAKNNRKKYKY
ncbi:MAG TPA: ribosome small subunit-dependent GTPase A [Cyclobacteriaceae bacterium]|nr:ribosome small subunit-dependent GTPase A [Cyclobacteriaceae bacterium]